MMKRCRRKPEVLERVQWFPGVLIEGVHAFPNDLIPADADEFENLHPSLTLNENQVAALKVNDSWMLVKPGDYVMRRPSDGKQWVVEKDAYDWLYEDL